MDNLKTSFGKRKVTATLKTSLVQEVFTNVAEKYDGMNDFMSLGAHRLWKKELIDLMNIQLTDTIIDVGSGTGDLIDLILNKKKINSIYSIDLNDEMLQYGKKRFKNKNVHFVKANAENLPFKNNFFDKYIVSFCLRNVTDIKKALNEALRILKPGGTFYCLEFSSPKSSLINSIYKSYKKNIIPWIGKKIAENEEAYQYLQESIDQFPSQEELLLNLTQIGFYQTKYLNMFNGIVSVHIGYKI
ncbi:MAG: bifunctional demethylmenaquinone methyltransferase/2-methoxy-6-polyprenyl-1,4-benzoquinol methylase UbiE [Candidatus Pelagibacter sp.]|nr:bifunctional demethylmenaquinone methyltransferase/2-methoxy-6-polyprenyl-1,4-benzoquinol methylase UbiE [Candidatus Pelagibacter sp.]